MGDRAWVGITFYEVPKQHLRAVFEFLDEMYGAWPGHPGEALVLGEQYAIDEMSLGWCSEVVHALVHDHPGIVVQAWQGEKYEFNGEVLMNTPALGTFLHEVDGGNHVILNADEIEKVYAELLASCDTDVFTPTAEQLKEALMVTAGVPWFEEFRALEAAAKPIPEAERTLRLPAEQYEEEPQPNESSVIDLLTKYIDETDELVESGEHIEQDIGVAQVLDDLRHILRQGGAGLKED